MLNYFLKARSNKSPYVYECFLSDFVNFNLILPPPFLQYRLRLNGKSTTRSQKTDWSHWRYHKFCLAETGVTCSVAAAGHLCFSRWIYRWNSSNHTFWANYFRVPGCRNQMLLLLFVPSHCSQRTQEQHLEILPWARELGFGSEFGFLCAWSLSVHMCVCWYCNGIQEYD